MLRQKDSHSPTSPGGPPGRERSPLPGAVDLMSPGQTLICTARILILNSAALSPAHLVCSAQQHYMAVQTGAAALYYYCFIKPIKIPQTVVKRLGSLMLLSDGSF